MGSQGVLGRKLIEALVNQLCPHIHRRVALGHKLVEPLAESWQVIAAHDRVKQPPSGADLKSPGKASCQGTAQLPGMLASCSLS